MKNEKCKMQNVKLPHPHGDAAVLWVDCEFFATFSKLASLFIFHFSFFIMHWPFILHFEFCILN